MLRLATWDAIGGQGGTNLVSPSQVMGWLDYALIDIQHTNAFHAVGVKTLFYLNPNRTRPGDPLYTNDETTFAHDCSGNRLKILPNPDPNAVLMDPHSHHLWQLWQQQVQRTIGNGYQFDMILEDTADELGKVLGVPCNFDQSDWTNQTNSMDTFLGYPIAYNALAGVISNPPGPSPAIGLNPTTAIGVAENCYVTYNTSPVMRQAWWQAMEDTEIDMMAQHHKFVCQGDSYDDASTHTYERIYFEASMLLAYDPNLIITTSYFHDPLAFHVFPESQFIALQPLVAQPTTIGQLQVGNGVYGREYKACYYAGRSIGACAVAVNDNSAAFKSQAFPWIGKYHHTLTLSGYDVLEGGTASVAGPAPSATMSGGTAVIAVQ